jgi:hypothetical protein
MRPLFDRDTDAQQPEFCTQGVPMIFARSNQCRRLPQEMSPRSWLRLVACLCASLCAGMAGCTPDAPPPAADLSAPHVLQNARTMRAGLASAIAGEGNITVYVNAVGARLCDAARASKGGEAIRSAVRVDVLTSDLPLAFTFGGEDVYLSTGAMRLCASEEDLAAALAHVYAHLLDQHQQAHVQVDSTDLLTVADVLLRSPTTDREEQIADQDGFLLFARGGWDPAKYADAWSRLGGVDGTSRAQAIRQWIATSAKPPDDWRQPLVADHFTFHNIMMAAGEIPDRSGRTAKLLMRCVKSCVGSDNLIDRTAAIESLEARIRGGERVIGPGPSSPW